MLACFRACGLREQVRVRAGACRATTGPDPHDVERHHAARGRVGERKRVGEGWLVLFELPAMLVTCLEIWGPHDVYVFKKLCRIMEPFRNFFCGQKLA